MADHVDSASDDRTANNAVRHTYRVLSDAEKAQMVAVKDAGAALIFLINNMRSINGKVQVDIPLTGNSVTVRTTVDRSLDIAVERAEEAVMWAVKHLTA
ncbi:Acb2/Tad1 domain-containing protein [Sphingomonas sp. PB4P5]|uniref:Acb2/Tad1 domain-containing protein n=1 Tax=Parasphingomonas puruogangriensis TaxID=3096155 RepID=UPI002FCA8DA0